MAESVVGVGGGAILTGEGRIVDSVELHRRVCHVESTLSVLDCVLGLCKVCKRLIDVRLRRLREEATGVASLEAFSPPPRPLPQQSTSGGMAKERTCLTQGTTGDGENRGL